MTFSEPETLDEVCSLLSKDPEARCLAGGASLVAMMNAGLLAPTQLISLRKIPDLGAITSMPDGSVKIGAMARHNDVAAFSGFLGAQRIISAAACRIGHPAIRNMGTIGGSICHADPSADYPTAITAADAVVSILGSEGARQVAARDFFVDWLETTLEQGEIAVSVTIPPDPSNASVHYEKFTRADGDFATVSVAACLGMSDGVVQTFRVVVGGVAEKPVRSPEDEAVFIGRPLKDSDIVEFSAALEALCNPIDDMRGSADYRLKLMPRLISRALKRAQADQLVSDSGETA
ncbi:MAG: xanthine dehydrogenase family protein subunit M [Alphaproteobacteria bacterium]|nr:xanthine dehydrogenase family protein subunit M [Alphaproteobacteria bacterium]